MTITAESITAALKKLGPVSPGELADHLGCEQPALGYHVKKMLDAGTLIASGKSKARRLALPDQKLEESPTPPQRRQKRKGKKKRAARKARTPRAPKASPAPAVPFVAALTADNRLVLIDGSQAPLIFSTSQAEEIATVISASGRFQ